MTALSELDAKDLGDMLVSFDLLDDLALTDPEGFDDGRTRDNVAKLCKHLNAYRTGQLVERQEGVVVPVDELVAFFRSKEGRELGAMGDYHGWSPQETAAHALRNLIAPTDDILDKALDVGCDAANAFRVNMERAYRAMVSVLAAAQGRKP